MSRNCKETILCSECGSDRHASALHVNKATSDIPSKAPTKDDGGEPSEKTAMTSANMKCAQICGKKFQGRSCSKTLLAKVYPRDNPDKALTVYVILDDQSNVSLAKSSFFELFDNHSDDIPYNLSSCAGHIRTSGRRARGYVVESMDGVNRLHIPTLIECDQIPNVRGEIATPEVAKSYPHLKDIAKLLPPMDKHAEILLLIGRDVPEAHHVLEQITGPHNSPFAQRLNLGWVVIGETCMGKVHKPDAAVNKINIHADGRLSIFPPCHSKFDIRQDSTPTEVHSHGPLQDKSSDIFKTTKDDNKRGLSVEDEKFLHLMSEEMYQSPEGNWVAPLPFKSPRQRLKNNKSEAMKRARSLHHSLMNNPRKKQHFVDFMGKVLENNHAETAPPLEHGEEVWYLPLFGVYHP